MSSEQKNFVDQTLEEERKESEARSILQDLERLITVPAERKRRWIWELLQNAQDCSIKKGSEGNGKVNVYITISSDKLVFAHDGVAFNLKQLLALVRRTSTKSYNNSEGNTGKFGTGFVTTHVLNRQVTVSGLLENESGLRQFSILVNREPTELEDLQNELSSTFKVINEFYERPAEILEEKILTKYEYLLNKDTHQLASESLTEFLKNLPFTLLINFPDKKKSAIDSVTITDVDSASSMTYSLSESENISSEVEFSQILNGKENISEVRKGLLHYTIGHVTIAVPATEENKKWTIEKVVQESKLFREFPLIGTEDWQIPFLVQSSTFLPSEPRDGIRTIKDNETKPDKTADENRVTLINFKDCSMTFFTSLKESPIENLHLLTESGLPIEKTEYTSMDWYAKEIQKPLRDFYLNYPLIVTPSGKSIPIHEAKFPVLFPEGHLNELFYSIAVTFYHDEFPGNNSYKDWQRIILQNTDSWNTKICGPDDLVKDLNESQATFKLCFQSEEERILWINELINFLHLINRADLGEAYSIYPNQLGELKKKQELRADPGLNEKIKSIGSRLNQPVFEQLLDTRITRRDGIDVFNTKGFFNDINVFIGSLNASKETEIEFTAVFELVATFNDTVARERERWYLLAEQMLPELVPERVVVNDIDEFRWAPAELASIKYVCWLIEQEIDFESFTAKYFQFVTNSAYEWINNFIEVLFRNQDYEELIRKYAIIPMQDGKFRKLEAGIFREDNKERFDPLFKEMYRDYTGKEDPGKFLIANDINNEKLPWKASDVLTKQIDELFISGDIEKKISPDAALNPLFHKLNDWFSLNEVRGVELFPHFDRERPGLYVKAFGPEVSKMVMAIHKLKRPIEEIEALANLNMNASELALLVKASLMAGGTTKLLQVAAEIEQAAKDAKWRKDVGDAAEKAFIDAMTDVWTSDITNPDMGYDFEIYHSDTEPYLLEIKSTVQFNETIKMSSYQGKSAKNFQHRYALCVLIREEHDTVVDKDYFIDNAKFVTSIGKLVEGKVTGMENGLQSIGNYKQGEIKTILDDERYSVYVSRSTWDEYLSFGDFIEFLKNDYFKMSVAD